MVYLKIDRNPGNTKHESKMTRWVRGVGTVEEEGAQRTKTSQTKVAGREPNGRWGEERVATPVVAESTVETHVRLEVTEELLETEVWAPT